MLYRFSHLLLYTVVLVGSYALEAPTRSSLISTASANTTSNNSNNTLKAPLSLRRTTLNSARKQLWDGNDDDLQSPFSIVESQQQSSRYTGLSSLVAFGTHWQQRKHCTELLI